MSIKGFALSFRIYIIVACVAVVVSCGEGDGPAPVSDSALPDEKSYTLVWADEFDVDGAPNVENWTMETGYGDNGWGNNEWQLYTNDTSSPDNNVRVEAGNLIITARCSAAVTDPSQCNNEATASRTDIITSARLNTKDKLEVKYGKIQARIKVPPGKGTWPAFWMLGSNFPEQPWPGAGEIDIMEIHQFFSNINTTHFTIHWCDDELTAPDECLFENGGRVFDEQFKEFDFALSDDYHVFEAVWDENNIVGKMDGITYFRASIDPGTQEEFLKSFFTILNLAVGGTLGGAPSAPTTWPQEMLVDWIRVYQKNQPDVLELVPDDREARRPYIRFVNSAEFGGDSVVTKLQRTLSEDDEDFDTVTPPAVPPLTGGTVVEFDYQSANTFFSGAAFEFRLKDVTYYDNLVFSLDTSVFPEFDDISLEIQDDRFTGDGAPGKTTVALSNYTPTETANWKTYTIPLTDFSSTNLENVALLGFWNPNNAADELIAGKLYLDDMKFVREPCSANGTVSFASSTIAGNAGATQITVTDSCLANKSKTVVVLVDNGTGSIGVSVPIIASGQGIATVNFGPTEDATSTIAIQEGDVLTATYTDANGVNQTDTADIFTAPLGVYSETYVDNVLEYTAIINDDTVTDDASTAVSALEGNVSLQAAYSAIDPENGYALDFTPAAGTALLNNSFESPDASGGLVACDGNPGTSITSWECFNFPFVFNYNFVTEPSPLPHDGNQTLGAVGNDAIVQQSISVNPGETVNASVYAMNWDGRPLSGIAIMQLNFFDASDNKISGLEVQGSADGSAAYTLAPKPGTAVSDWTRMELSGVAPAGSASAQLFLIHVIGGGVPESTVFFDDATLTTATGGPSNDISYFNTLKFGVNISASAGLMDLEVRMTDGSAGSASAYLSDFVPTAGAVAGWDEYEIPLSVFTGLDLADVSSLGFYNASTDSNADPGYPTLFNTTLYFDDIRFVIDAPTVQIGTLVNSPVEAAAFETDTQSGITNASGEFQYLQGEMITFKVGDIVLGPVVAGPVITPVELTGSLNPTDQPAVNMLVFLQSIDANQDPSDGITISAATRAAAVGQTLDFTLGSSAFTAALTAVINTIAAGNSVVTETDAVNNYYQTFPPVASAADTIITVSPATVDAGGTDFSTITVQAADSSGNNITASAGTVTLFSTGSAVINDTTLTDDNDDGIYTTTVTNMIPESVTIAGTIDGNAISSTANLVFVGAVSGDETTIAATSPVEADNMVESIITVQARDTNGNSFVKSAGDVVLTITEAASNGSAKFRNGLQTTTAVNNGDGTYTAYVKNSETEEVTISGSIDSVTITCTSGIFPCANTIDFGTGVVDPTKTTISASPSSVINDGIKTSTITVQARDTSGGDFTTSAGAVTLLSSGSGIIENQNDNNDGTYTATVRNSAAEEVTITGTIGGNPITDNATVIFAPAVAVFSDTNADTALDESIENLSGCNPTSITDITTLVYPAFEGANLKQADFAGSPNSCNGFVFNFAAVPSTGITPVSDDFQSYTPTSGFTAWSVFSDNAGLGGYFIPVASTNGPQISALADDGAGNQYLNFYANYDNLAVHDNPPLQEAISIFHEFSFTGADTVNGDTWVFDFDYASNPLAPVTGNTEVGAFIRVFDPVFNILDEQTFDTGPSATPSFQSGQLAVTLNPAWVDGVVQIGFNNLVGNYDGSGRFYDNVDFNIPPVDISGYATLKFAIDSSLAVTPALADLEVRLEDADGGSASVYLSDYEPIPGTIGGADWDLYEIPVSDFTGTLDSTIVQFLGFLDASSTVSAPPGGTVTLFDATLYIDDVHFIELP